MEEVVIWCSKLYVTEKKVVCTILALCVPATTLHVTEKIFSFPLLSSLCLTCMKLLYVSRWNEEGFLILQFISLESEVQERKGRMQIISGSFCPFIYTHTVYIKYYTKIQATTKLHTPVFKLLKPSSLLIYVHHHHHHHYIHKTSKAIWKGPMRAYFS